MRSAKLCLGLEVKARAGRSEALRCTRVLASRTARFAVSCKGSRIDAGVSGGYLEATLTRLARFSACSKSAIRSSGSSMPTESRTSESVTP